MVFNILNAIPLRTDVRIVALDLAPELAKWLAAIGIEPGVTARVLRRALFGGPLHLRLSTGGELAIHADLARSIRVEPLAQPARSRRPEPALAAKALTEPAVAAGELGYPAAQ